MEKLITLYQGSEKVVETPTFGLGKENNDFGLGFIVPKARTLRKNGRCPLFEMVLPIDTHWIRNI